jgi:hypothetical protein
MESKDVPRRFLLAGLGGAVAGSLLAGKLHAGDLRPPPGPIGPTGRGLKEIYDKIARTDAGLAEPRLPVESLPGSDAASHVISQSGSYYLTQNLLAAVGKHAIDIQADNVDLDLCGFHVIGASGGAGLPGKPACGIRTDRQNVTVCDGSLIGWDVAVDFVPASRFVLWDLVSIDAVKAGFRLGDRGQAYDCDAYGSAAGFSAEGSHTLVEDCGVWTCAIGFLSTGTRNLFLCNCACECGTAYEIAPSSAYGPIVSVEGAGDISSVPHADHPCANYVY